MSEATEARQVSSSVEVAVDPQTAFAAFTEELDLWWKRGPINHFDGGRMLAMRMEPGVGGRLLEVYAEGEALELGRITVWEPGRRLAWDSSIDDVRTEVWFEPTATGTRVRVVARIPEGGRDAGGTAWVRVTHKWFGAWCARRESAPREVRDIARLALGVSYARPAAAGQWLAHTLGLEPMDPLPEVDSADHAWIELRVGDSSLMLFRDDEATGPQTQVYLPWIYVDDVQEHYEQVRSSGATIVEELASPWGLPFYVVADPEGRRWRIAQARPSMH
jgi:uncharacterized glyoxalase superfamily protein PhnB